MNICNEYRLETDPLYSVIHCDEHGVATDLNAEGDPCSTRVDFVEFTYELCEQGAFNEDVRRQLIEEAVDVEEKQAAQQRHKELKGHPSKNLGPKEPTMTKGASAERAGGALGISPSQVKRRSGHENK